MPIVIAAVLAPTERGCRVRVKHNDNVIEAEIAASEAEARWFGAAPVPVELAFSRVITSRPRLSSEAPGIFPHKDGALLVGVVRYVTPLDGGGAIFDVFLGPEYAAFDETALAGLAVDVGTELAVVVADLCFYPTRV